MFGVDHPRSFRRVSRDPVVGWVERFARPNASSPLDGCWVSQSARPNLLATTGYRLKNNVYDVHLSLALVDESCIRCVALLIEGRLRRQSRWRSEAWRPAAAACNRRLGRQGTPPARHYDLAARSFALRMRRKCRKLKRGPGRKSPRWSAERRASPRHGGAGAFAKAPRRARLRHVAGARHAPERLSALRHPSIGVELEDQTPGANASREREWLFDIVKRKGPAMAVERLRTGLPGPNRATAAAFGRTNPTSWQNKPNGLAERKNKPNRPEVCSRSARQWSTVYGHQLQRPN